MELVILESPFAGERERNIDSDYGISKGMEYGIKDAEKNNRVIEYRTIL